MKRMRTYFNRTDMGNAERFIDQHGQNVRYCTAIRQWLYWDGTGWSIDHLGIVREMAKDTIRAILDEAEDAEPIAIRIDLTDWALKSQSGRHLEAMLRFAQSDPEIAISRDQLDRLLGEPRRTVKVGLD